MKSNFKKNFPLLSGKHKKLVYLDSASTTHKPASVIKAIEKWYIEQNANAGRGVYSLAEKATEVVNNCRISVANLIGSDDNEIVFTKGATESINLVALAWAEKNIKKGDVILITALEHHSNIVPWQLLAAKIKCTLQFWPLASNGALQKLSKKDWKNVKLVCMTHCSNVTGTINPINTITKEAHRYGAKILIDATQSIVSEKINVKKLQADFLVFSGHKMFGPTGVGILYINKQRLKESVPVYGGGESIEQVTFTGTRFKEGPQMLEPGTLPLAQLVGLQTAIDFIEKNSKKRIKTYLSKLSEHARRQLEAIDDCTLLPCNKSSNGHIISFNINGIHPHDLATWLDKYNIAIRAGHHCAQPLHEALQLTASARISLQIYNTKTDIDYFIKTLKKIIVEYNSSVV